MFTMAWLYMRAFAIVSAMILAFLVLPTGAADGGVNHCDGNVCAGYFGQGDMRCESGEYEYRAVGASSGAAGVAIVPFHAACHESTDPRDGSTTTLYYWTVGGVMIWGEISSGECFTYVAVAGYLGCPVGGPPSLVGLP